MNITRKHNLWLFLLTIVVTIQSFLLTYFLVTANSEKYILDKDATTINSIIGIAGFLAAFSAISLYSIFNASVDREREKLNELGNVLEHQVKVLENQVKESKLLKETFKNDTIDDKKIQESLKNKDAKIYIALGKNTEWLTQLNNFLILTSEFASIQYRKQVIVDFIISKKRESLHQDMQQMLQNYCKEYIKKNPNESLTKDLDSLLSFLNKQVI